MNCHQKVNRKMLIPRRRDSIVPIGSIDLLANEGGTKFKSKKSLLNWFKKLLRLQK